MKIAIGTIFASILLTSGLVVTPAASAQSTSTQGNQFASNLNIHMSQTRHNDQQNFVIYKFLLDMGARANGTKKDKPGAHAAWCAKIHKSYDAGSNTFEAFNKKRYTCRSPYAR